MMRFHVYYDSYIRGLTIFDYMKVIIQNKEGIFNILYAEKADEERISEEEIYNYLKHEILKQAKLVGLNSKN